MHLSLEILLLLCVLSQLFGFAIFLRGFLVIKSVIPGKARIEDQPLEPHPCDQFDETCGTTDGIEQWPVLSHHSRMVLVLIDALRSDFVMPSSSSQLPRMEFLSSLIEEGAAFGYLAKAHPPTVTMPRIKALTSGTIPGFVDVVLNFDSESLTEDNMITQLKRMGKSVVFYGDDTWIRLFPDAFVRSEGTTSFFVTDYTEVDDNVTRHIGNELDHQDWDVLILHYLGLDHIGHLAGPTSPLVPRKLREMDEIVKRFHSTLKEQDVISNQSTLLLVCGDHGMSDQGSHGGSSASETNTPLVMIPLDGQRIEKSLSPVSEVYQIDLVPTLAVLLGTAIPQNSLGVLIPEPLLALPLRTQLQAWYRNSQQLLKVYQENVPNYDRREAFHALQATMAGHQQWLDQYGNASGLFEGKRLAGELSLQYRVALREMRDSVADSLINYDMQAMVEGIILLILSLCGMLLLFVASPGHLSLELNTASVWVFVASMFVGIWVHLAVCTAQSATSLLCQGSIPALLLTSGFLFMVSVWITTIAAYRKIYVPHKWTPNKLVTPTMLLSAGCVLHTLSLLASSFVEEEHQTWYFFTVTVLLTLLLRSAVGLLQKSSTSETTAPGSDDKTPEYPDKYTSKSTYDTALHSRIGKRSRHLYESQARFSSHGTDYTEQKVSESDTTVSKSSPWTLLYGLFCLIICRVMRSWNSTGDKWSHLPDVGDWLDRPEHKAYLSVVVSVAMAVYLVATTWRKPRHWLRVVLLTLGLFGIYCHQTSRGALLLPGLYPYDAVYKRVVEARLVYIILFCFWIHIVARYLFSLLCQMGHPRRDRHGEPNEPHRSCGRCDAFLSLKDWWGMLALLLMRPHNIPLTVMGMLLERLLSKVLQRHKLSNIFITMLYMWMGQACYFYQGNSNSLSSVDIAAGYVGVVEYNPVVIGILMAMSTYAAPVYWWLSLLSVGCVREQHGNRFGPWMSSSFVVLVLSRSLPLAVYPMLVTAQRYHLFVWTVFSPKLLYEGMLTVVTSVMIIFLMVATKLYPCKTI